MALAALAVSVIGAANAAPSVTKLRAASGAAAGDQFGISVGVSGDTMVVGAINDDDDGSNSGSAYVYTRTGTTWTQQAKLTANDAATGDLFGYSVGVSGGTIVVGARFDDKRAGSDSGSAYVSELIQDSDGDGVPDDQDAFPNDPSETTDSDGEVSVTTLMRSPTRTLTRAWPSVVVIRAWATTCSVMAQRSTT